MSLILLDNVNKNYTVAEKIYPVLKNISLCISTGEMIAILGPSGSGKSTLMNILGLLDTVDSGLYCIDGQNTKNLTPDELAGLRNQYIGFVFQQFNLLPRLTAGQNIALPLIYRPHLKTIDIQHNVKQSLIRVGMDHFIDHRPTQLSGGQQQRIAIARALVGSPKLILADEPTGALDSKTGQDIINLFLSLNEEGRTVLIVTHDEKVARKCHRQLVLKDGQIVP